MNSSDERKLGPEPLGWCFNCNVPILDAKACGICSSESVPLHVAGAHLKPIFKYEKRFHNQVIDRSLGISQDLLPANQCFVSRSSIVVDGKKAFRVFHEDSDWKAETFGDYKEGDLEGSIEEDTLKANEYILQQKEQEATSFLENVFEKYDLPRVVSISGGKDSAVALSLAKEVDNHIQAIYMNTTLDFPETVCRYIPLHTHNALAYESRARFD
jgi:hypothetical protein